MTRPPGGPGHRPRSAVHAALRHWRPQQLSHVGSSAITVRAPCSRRRGCRLRREGSNGRRTSACALTATPVTARARSQSAASLARGTRWTSSLAPQTAAPPGARASGLTPRPRRYHRTAVRTGRNQRWASRLNAAARCIQILRDLSLTRGCCDTDHI